MYSRRRTTNWKPKILRGQSKNSLELRTFQRTITCRRPGRKLLRKMSTWSPKVIRVQLNLFRRRLTDPKPSSHECISRWRKEGLTNYHQISSWLMSLTQASNFLAYLMPVTTWPRLRNKNSRIRLKYLRNSLSSWIRANLMTNYSTWWMWARVSFSAWGIHRNGWSSMGETMRNTCKARRT